MARLAGFVHVRDADGAPHVFGPNDDVPDWARVKIRNPRAWVDGADPEPRPQAPAPDRTVRTDQQATQAVQPADAPEPPPRGGRGSNAVAWRAYADAMGVQVAPDADRDDVIAELDERGISTGREDDEP